MSSAVTIWVENHFDFALVLLYRGIEHSCYIDVTATESTIVSLWNQVFKVTEQSCPKCCCKKLGSRSLNWIDYQNAKNRLFSFSFTSARRY